MEEKEKETLGGRIFTLICIIAFTFLEVFLGYHYAIDYPIRFILILPIMGVIIFLYMDSQKTDKDNWLDKLCLFHLGVFVACIVLVIGHSLFTGVKKIFSNNSRITEQTEQYEDCLRKYHYNEEYCYYLKPIQKYDDY